jgi:hypothetical protein
MSPVVGVVVQATEVPANTINQISTATAFMVGFTDSGPVGKPVQITSLSSFATAFGTPTGSGNPYNSRTTTCSVLFDAVDTFLRESNGTTVYVSRVTHGTPVAASIALAPSAALTITAAFPGVGGNGIYVAVNNTGAAYVLTLQDSAGNVLGVSPSLSTLAAGVAWVLSTGLATAVSSGATLPSTAAATAMTGGTDNRGSATITDWQTALASFSLSLGPGQVLAPGQTNTGLSGIWSALGIHAQANNRVAICDMDDGASAATAVSAIGSFGTSAVSAFCGFWSGNLTIPGVTGSPGTTRSVAPSPLIAALCANVDATGNPNRAAAGVNFAPIYANASATLVSGTLATYSLADLYTLNGAGINTFASKLGIFENYGFVSSVSPASDGIYWQFNHARLLMALETVAQSVGEPFVFSQIDGRGSDTAAFGSALSSSLKVFYDVGALFGATANDAFSVDTGPNVNTPTSIAAGQLKANCNVRMSPFAQMVTVQLNAVPTTQILV